MKECNYLQTNRVYQQWFSLFVKAINVKLSLPVDCSQQVFSSIFVESLHLICYHIAIKYIVGALF